VYSDGASIRSNIARKWANEYNYPLTDGGDLARVARFLSVEFADAEYPASQYVEELTKVASPDFSNNVEPYTILADLPLPIYITTNYDSFMEQALVIRKRDVKMDYCRWMKTLDDPSHFTNGFQPDVANPAVFHLYGHAQSQPSMVLSEDDYFQFLINVSYEPHLIPTRIQKAISNTSLMLIGFSLEDWDFRILFHLLSGYLKKSTSKTHVAVQISPLTKEAPEELKKRAQSFFDKYFESRSPDIRVSWDTTQEFLRKLKENWENSGYDNN